MRIVFTLINIFCAACVGFEVHLHAYGTAVFITLLALLTESDRINRNIVNK